MVALESEQTQLLRRALAGFPQQRAADSLTLMLRKDRELPDPWPAHRHQPGPRRWGFSHPNLGLHEQAIAEKSQSIVERMTLVLG
jgi:hypothetical protein